MPDPIGSRTGERDGAATLDQVDEIIARLDELGLSAAALDPVRDWVRDRREGKPERAWYFGCEVGAGHYLFDSTMRSPHRDDPVAGDNRCGPFDRLDGALTPTETTKQSAAAIHHRDGWTALAMHDYSVDKRGNSNAVFIFDADLSWDAALEAAHEWFPGVVERIEAAAPISGPHTFNAEVRRRG